MRYDATSSGLQHIAMLTQDRGLALLVNISNPTERPNDIYTDFAEYVNKTIGDAEKIPTVILNKKKNTSGIDIQELKKIKADRKLVKAALMSYSYNAKDVSMIDSIIDKFSQEHDGYRYGETTVQLKQDELVLYAY